jgi:hypothetical protein
MLGVAAACSDKATGPSASRDAVVGVTVGVSRNAVLAQDGEHQIPITVTLSRVPGATTYVSLQVCLSQNANPGDRGGGGASPHCAGVTRAQSPVSLVLNARPTTWGGPGLPPTIAYQYVHAVLYPGDVIFSPLGDTFVPPISVDSKTLEWPISLVPLPR